MVTTSRKRATEIISVLKYNPQLTEDERILCVELRLDQLIDDIEKSCDESRKRQEDNAIIVDSRPQDIPILSEMLVAKQKELN